MAKYKVGDQVVVRDDLNVLGEYFMDDGVTCDSFVASMIPYMGLIVTIDSITPVGKYKICGNNLNWTDEMFAGLAEEFSHEVAVDDLL